MTIWKKLPFQPRILSHRSPLAWLTMMLATILGATSAMTSPEARFERLGPYGGTVRSLLISSKNSKIVYLGTRDGQLFRSTDGGGNWRLLYPGLGQRQLVIDTIVEDPIDVNRIFVGAWDLRSDGGGLFESRDAGRSWNRVPLPKTSVAVRSFAISKGNPSHMIAGTLAGVFLTSDGGRTWQMTGIDRDAFRQVESVAIDPRDPRIIFVGTWHLGYRSNDFGKTWVRNARGMIADSDVFAIAIDDRNTHTVYASACTGLYRSIDRGISWTRLKVFPKSYLVRAQVVYIDPIDSNRVYGGTTEGLFVSRNSGKVWSRITSPDLTVNAIQVDPANANVILLGTESYGILRSEDGGRNWTESNTGFVNRSIARIVTDPTSPNRLLVGEFSEGRAGGFHVLDNPPGRWAQLSEKEKPGEGMLSLVDLPGDRGRIAGTARGAFLQRPNSRTWSGLAGPIGALAVYDLTLDSKGTWIFAGTNDGVYRARLEDLNFQKPPRYRLIPRVFSLLASRSTPDRLLAGTHMGVLRSDDSGTTWNIASDGIPDHTSVACLAASPAGEDHLFAGTTAGLFESTDGGKVWKPASDGRLGRNISSIIFLDTNGMRVMAADNSSGGVFLSGDGGATWGKIDSPEYGSPVRFLARDPLSPSIVYLGTGTEGIYRLQLQSFDIRTPTSGLRSAAGSQKPESGR